MLPVLFYLVLSNTVGETPFAPGIQAIEAEARLFPPKRSPWHGKGDTALKVTLWETPGTPKATLRKLRVDATHDGTASRDTYWFEDGQLAWGIQTRPDVERRLTFARGHLTAAEERKGGRFYPMVAREVTRLDSDIATLVKTCLAAPGLRTRQATVKAIEANRVVFNAGPEIDAWLTRRPGDQVAASLVGKKVQYDFTAVDLDGHETDYLNSMKPLSGATTAAAAPGKTVARKKSSAKSRSKTRRKAT